MDIQNDTAEQKHYAIYEYIRSLPFNKVRNSPQSGGELTPKRLDKMFGEAQLKIYYSIGETIKEQFIQGHSTVINRDDLQGGIHFFQLINRRGIVSSGKLIIE